MKRLIVFILLFCMCGDLYAQNVRNRLDFLLGSYAKENIFNGSALIARHGKILLDKGYGYRNVNDSMLNDPQTVFQIASVTKPFTAVVILKLCELKKLSLSDPLSKFYPQFPDADHITIFHLLTHTSGITDRPDSSAKVPVLPADASREQYFIAQASAKRLAFPMGSKREYSNSGYILLGYIIEKVTGLAYFEAVSRYIFKPLGMHSSCFDLAKCPLRHKATGYAVFTATEKKEAPPIDPYGLFAAGAICSTVEDLYKWHQGLQAYQIVSKASLDQAYTPFINKYGFGWNVDSLRGKRLVSHSGGVTGFNGYISRIPEDDTCIILLNNKPGGRELSDIVKKAYAILLEAKL